jgi:hypothetical protein
MHPSNQAAINFVNRLNSSRPFLEAAKEPVQPADGEGGIIENNEM